MVKKRVNKTSSRIKVCLECLKHIDLKKDPYVEFNVFNTIGVSDRRSYRHLLCWEDYFDEQVQKRIIQYTKDEVISSFLKKNILKERIIKKLNKHGNKKRVRRKKN
jgi:hypothetical protein